MEAWHQPLTCYNNLFPGSTGGGALSNVDLDYQKTDKEDDGLIEEPGSMADGKVNGSNLEDDIVDQKDGANGSIDTKNKVAAVTDLEKSLTAMEEND